MLPTGADEMRKSTYVIQTATSVTCTVQTHHLQHKKSKTLRC